MAGAYELGVAYVSLVVSTRGVAGDVRRGLAEAGPEGDRAGREVGKRLSASAARSTNLDGVTRKVDAAQATAARSTAALGAAQRKQQGASSALTIAEQRLVETRGRYAAGSSQVLAAEQRVTTARQRSTAAQQQAGFASVAAAQSQSRLATAAGTLANSQLVQAAAAGELGRAQLKSTAGTQQLGAAQSGALASSTALAGAQARLGAAFASDAGVKTKSAAATQQLNTASKATPGALSGVSAALTRAGVELGSTTTQSERARQSLTGLGGGAVVGGIRDLGTQLKSSLGIGLAAGITATVGSAVNLEATFSRTMAQVAAAASVPAPQMERLNDLAIQLGADTSFSAGEAAAAMLELAKAGLSPATIESGALAATLTQAEASGDGLAESAGAIGNALNMFSLSGSQAGEVAAAFAGGANASTAEVRDLTMGLAQVGPGAAAAGMSLQETVGTLAAFSNAGLSGSDAGTSLKQMLTSLVPSSKPALQAMRSLGLVTADGANAFFTASGEMRSTAEIAQLLQNATKNLSDEERTRALSTIFGSDASRAANILAREGAAGLTTYIDATKNATAAQDMAAANMSGTAGALERLSGAWETFRLQIGQSLAPIIQVGAGLAGLGLEGAAKSLGVLVPLVLTGGGAWAAYTIGVKAATAATALMEMWTKRAAIAQGILTAVSTLNPFGLAAVAAAALAAGLVVLWQRSETFRNVVTGAWTAVKNVVTSVGTALGAVFTRVATAIRAAVTLLTTGDFTGAIRTALHVEEDHPLIRVLLAIRAGFLSLRDTLVSAVAPAMGSAQGAVAQLREAFAALAASPLGQWVRETASTFAASLGPAFTTIATLVTTQLLPAIMSIGSVVGPALGAAISAFASFAGAVINSPIFKFLAGAALAVVMGFVNGVINTITGLVKIITGVTNVIAGVLTGDWSRMWEGVKGIVLGAVQAVWGILNIWIAGRVVSLAGGAVRAVGAAFGSLGGLIRVGVQAAIGVVRGFVTNIGAVMSRVGVFLAPVGAAFSAMGGLIRSAVAVALTAAGGFVTGVVSVMARVGAALAPVGAAFGLLGAAVSSAWATISPALSAMGAAVGGALTTAWRGFMSTVTGVWATIRGAITEAWAVISSIFTIMGQSVGTVLSAAFRAFQVVVYNVFHAVHVTIYNAWQIISAIFSLLAEWLGPKLSTAFRAFRTVAATVWGAVQAVIGAAWNWLLANVFTPIRDWLTATFTTAMNNFRNNTTAIWNAVSNAISTVWNFLLTRVFTPIQDWLVNRFVFAVTLFRNRTSAAWALVQNAVRLVWDFLLTRVFTPIWNWLVNTFNTAVTNFRNNTTRAWNAVSNVISAVWNFLLGRVFTPIWNWLVNTFNTAMNNFRNNTTRAWNAVRDALRAGWQFIDSRVFTPLKNGLQAVWNWFGTVVTGISNKWNELREKLAAPIRFVVNTIIRDNLVRAWNAVAAKVNLKKFDFKGFDRGGWTGPGGKYKPAGVVHADEFVVKKKSRRRFERANPGALDHINRTGQLPGYAAGGHVGIPGYARGGLAKPWPTYVAAVVRKLFPGIGAIGGYGQRAGKSDHATGNALDFMVPVDSALGDRIAAWSMANFQPLNLKYVIWKQRINSGSGWRGMEDRGSITQNHRDHPHLSFVHDTPGNKSALGSVLSAEEVAAALAGGAGGFSIPNPLHAAAMKLVDIPLNFAKGLIGGIAGRFGSSEWTDIAAGAAKLPFDWVQQFLHDKINSVIPATIFGGGAADDTAVTTGDGGKGVAQWKPTVQAALKRAGLPTTPAYTSAWLRQISSESGGNPNIAQQIRDINGTGERAGVGLVQVIPGTFAAYRDPALPNNRRDPLANLTAGMRYARSRYGVAGMLSVIGKGRGYAEGGRVEPELFDTGGFLRPGISLVENATGRPERVLTHEQEQELMRGRQQIVINGIKHDSIPEFADALNWSLTRAETRSRYAGVR